MLKPKNIYDRIRNSLNKGEEPDVTKEMCEVKDSCNGRTAFHYGLSNGDLEAVKWMLEKGVNPNVKDGLGMGGLHYISTWKDLNLIRIMLNYGANPDIEDNNGVTPGHRAAMVGKLDHLEYFHNAGANFNKQDHNGQTALHYAAYWGCIKSIEYLIWDCHIKTDIKDKNGMTAMDLYPDMPLRQTETEIYSI